MKRPLSQHNQHRLTHRLNEQGEGIPRMRLGIRMRPHEFESLSEEASPWYESKEEVEAGARKTRRQKKQVEALRAVMREHLSPSQIEALELRFFEGLSLPEIGRLTGRDPSSVSRKISSGLRKLRKVLPTSLLQRGEKG